MKTSAGSIFKTTLQLSIALRMLLLTMAPTAARGDPDDGPSLPTGKRLSPSGSRGQQTNSFPVTMATSPDKRWLAILNNGYGTRESGLAQSIAVLDLQTEKLVDFPDMRFGLESGKNKKRPQHSFFLGLAFSGDGKRLYASVGSISDPLGKEPGNLGNGIAVYSFVNGTVKSETFWPIPLQKLAQGSRQAKIWKDTPEGMAVPYPAGLAVVPSKEGERLLVADNLSDDALLLDARNGRVLQRFDFSEGPYVPAAYPCSVAVSKDGAHAWVSLWNTSAVGEIDLKAGTVLGRNPMLASASSTDASAHPTTLLLSNDGKRLFVCLSNVDSVAQINLETGRLLSMISTVPPGQRYGGTFPDALALSEDGTRLFIALASSNAIAVVSVDPLDLTQSVPYGFIPTEWYPTALAVMGGDLFVAAGKGRGTGSNAMSVQPPGVILGTAHPYIPTLLHGTLARVPLAHALEHLEESTKAVEKANLLDSAAPRIIFKQAGNPVKHVIYIIKENRTYDQVLGDLKPGDGDASLCMYGADVTPNQHALARQFGVIDNFYASGEVSGNGHNWAMSAITSDYLEKTWQINYRNAQRPYDYEGEVAGDFPLLLGIPDVNEPATGYLWGNAGEHGVTHRNYGEFVHTLWLSEPKGGAGGGSSQADGVSTSGTHAPLRTHVSKGDSLPTAPGEPSGPPSPWPWDVPLPQEDIATKPELRDHFDPFYPDFNLMYPDQLRADEFLREFKGFVKAGREGAGNTLPALAIVRLGNDHTQGTSPGAPTPAAMVADNDLALGRIVEAVSHSPYWDDTVIMAVEDDAQNGADHVDAHRTTAYVISKYSPGTPDQPFVAHDFYTTVSMVHTIEMLLGMPPMNHNDASAPVMAPLFSGDGKQPPFNASYVNRDNGLLYRVNTSKTPGAKLSSTLDFSREDAANAAQLNKILWRDRMGARPMPPPPHRDPFQDDDGNND
jgi:DNA-binding beta-propeller fold protein YncE